MTTTWYRMYYTTAFECPWCTKAKELLDVYGMDYVLLDIHTDETAKEEFLAAGHRTVPQVYREGNLIGGYDKTQEHLRLNHSPKARDEELSERLTRI